MVRTGITGKGAKRGWDKDEIGEKEVEAATTDDEMEVEYKLQCRIRR